MTTLFANFREIPRVRTYAPFYRSERSAAELQAGSQPGLTATRGHPLPIIGASCTNQHGQRTQLFYRAPCCLSLLFEITAEVRCLSTMAFHSQPYTRPSIGGVSRLSRYDWTLTGSFTRLFPPLPRGFNAPCEKPFVQPPLSIAAHEDCVSVLALGLRFDFRASFLRISKNTAAAPKKRALQQHTAYLR